MSNLPIIPPPATRKGSATITTPSDTEILISRCFDAPATAVYRALTTPDLVRRWWGGDRGEVIVADIDGVTTLRTLVQCASRALRDAQLGSGMELGMQESYDHLDDLVTER